MEIKKVLKTDQYDIGYTLLLPDSDRNQTCVLIVGGSLSHDRDGQIIKDGVGTGERFALKELAQKLLEGGYASLRYDRCGFGDTRCHTSPCGANDDDKAVLISLYRYLKGHKNIGKIILAGESAGGYFSCMAARDGLQADGYIFLGALCSNSPDMLRYNYERLYRFACQSEANMAWAKKVCLHWLTIGANIDTIILCAEEGVPCIDVEYAGYRLSYHTSRLAQEIREQPSELFCYIHNPTLILQGELDMNVPPNDRVEIARILLESGNYNVTCRCIPQTDHSFQLAPLSERERIIERFNFCSFRNPYSQELYDSILGWLNALYSPTSELSRRYKL